MSIDARPLKSGKTVYDVRLRDPHGRVYKRTFRTKRSGSRRASSRTAPEGPGWTRDSAG